MSPDKQSVEQRVNKLEERFSDLIDCTYKALLEKKVDRDVRCFRSSLLSVKVSQKHIHQEFIHEHLLKVDKETTFDDLWIRLSNYCNFLNFDLLEHVISKFGSEDLKHKMECYKCELQSFRKATRLRDFIDCWPVQGERPPETDLREFVATMKHDWENCTLEDLETLKGVITHKFFVPEFAIKLKKIMEGSIVITWLVPAPLVKALQEAVQSTSSDFFLEHKIETITIDREVCHPSPSRKHVDYLKEQFTSHSMREAQKEISPLGILPEKLTIPRTGYHSSYSSRVPSSFHTPTLKEMEELSLMRKSHTRLGDTMPRAGFLSSSSEYWFETSTPPEKDVRKGNWVNPPTPAGRYVREKCVDEVSEHVKLLPSPEQYLSKAEVEADPSLPTNYKNYLSSTPAIRAALYTTFNVKMAAEVFTWSLHHESPPPTTITELFTAFTLKTLVDYLSTHPVYHKEQVKVTTFSDLPTDVYKQFQDLCRMAYKGILNRQQLVFSAPFDFPIEFAPLSLMQKVPQLYTEHGASYYHFIHLTLQEFLAAVHISQFLSPDQAELVREHLDSGHFKMTIRFLAGLTMLANIPPEISTRLIKSDNTKLTYFHLLFEAKDNTLCSDVIYVTPHSWTPLDYYVTGHAISHSNCPWRLNFVHSSFSSEKLKLFCLGCAAPRGIGCKGHILYADFSSNQITSKSIQPLLNIPPHILQDMRELRLHDNKLDGSACDLLAKAVLSMSRLEEFWLGDNPIGSGGAVEVIKALCGSGVKELWLDNTGIGVQDCEALCKLLESTQTLQWLRINQNNLSSESVASIITGLSHNTTLTEIDISNSHVDMVNVVSLASILRDKSKLTVLWLRNCHISSKGAVELAAALCKNTALKNLYLSHNSIGEHVEGVAATAKMLVENKTLIRLVLNDCHINGEGASALGVALCKNSMLKRLDLNCNPIGVEGASSMSDMLQHNTSLEELDLRDISVGEEGVHQLINSLKLNQTLRVLYLPEKYESETSDYRIRWW